MTPNLDRRGLLGALGAGVLGAVGYGASQRPADPIETSPPEPGTWPSAQYDAANTSANPHATVGSDPTVDWRTPVGDGATVVIGPEQVFVGGDGLVALDRTTGRVTWERPLGGNLANLHVRQGTLYYSENGPRGGLRALDAETGAQRWRTQHIPWDSLLAADSLVVCDSGGARGLEYSSGEVRWQWNRHGTSHIAAADGHLYGQNDHLSKYAVPDLLDVRTGGSPDVAWRVSRRWGTGHPVIGDGRLVSGATLPSRVNRPEPPVTAFPDGATPSPPEAEPPVPAIAAYDVETGDRVWGSRWSDRVPVEPDVRYGVEPLAVAHGRVYATLTIDGDTWESKVRRRPGLLAYSLDDGTLEWTAEFYREPSSHTGLTAVCATADSVVVANRPAYYPDSAPGHPPALVALDPADGSERWRIELPDITYAIAVVGDTVFVAIANGPTLAIS